MENEFINPDYVISIDYCRTGGRFSDNLYAIIFKGNSIEEFIYMPKDYSFTEFIDVILNKYNKLNYIIILDSFGLSRGILDYLKSKNITNYFIINNKYGELALHYNEKAVEEILNFAINSNFDYIKELEFKKLIKEMNNLKVVFRGNIPIFEFGDVPSYRSRAFCYLQYIAYLYCLIK